MIPILSISNNVSIWLRISKRIYWIQSSHQESSWHFSFLRQLHCIETHKLCYTAMWRPRDSLIGQKGHVIWRIWYDLRNDNLSLIYHTKILVVYLHSQLRNQDYWIEDNEMIYKSLSEELSSRLKTHSMVTSPSLLKGPNLCRNRTKAFWTLIISSIILIEFLIIFIC